jgi:polysaccharide export outer membrane protein
MTRNRKVHLLPLALIIALIAIVAGCADNVYTPYGTSEEIPKAFYEGRPENRRFPVDRLDNDTSVTLAMKHFPPPPLPKVTAEEAAAAIAEEGYLMGPGDVLEIIYQLKAEGTQEEYRLEVLDAFRVSFLYTPNLDAEVTVRPDGKVNLPIVGDIQAGGRTLREVKQELVTLYSKSLRDPVIQVVVTRSNNAIEELKRAITTAPRGQSRLTPIRPDGYISLPLIGDIKAAGRTIPDLSDAVVKRYREESVRNIDVTVVLLEVKAPVVFIMGEVNRPGPITLETPTDIWRAIGLAGGFTDSANPGAVRLARAMNGTEARYELDFFVWSSGRDTTENVLLQRGDIVHVPREAGRFVYVMGEVEKPGRLKLEMGEEIRVSQALATAGRILSTARRSQVLLLSKHKGEPIVMEVDLRAIMNPNNYTDPGDYPPRDPVLKAGDVVYVSSSPVGDFNHFAEVWFRNGIWTVIPFTVVYNLN